MELANFSVVFTGARCTEDVDECALNANPCKNGGKMCESSWDLKIRRALGSFCQFFYYY